MVGPRPEKRCGEVCPCVGVGVGDERGKERERKREEKREIRGREEGSFFKKY